MRFFERLLVAVLGGALYSAPFLEPHLAPLAFVGMAPVLVLLAGRRGELLSTSSALAWSFVPATVAIALCCLPLLTVSWVALAMQGGLIHPWLWLGLLAFAWVRRRTGWPVALLWPCCWAIAEWGWSFYSIGALAIGLSGYTQFIYPRLIQIADFSGALGVGIVIQVAVGAFADVAIAWREQRRFGALREARLSIGAAAAMLAGALAYGSFRLAGAETEEGPKLALIQPALPHEYNDAQTKLVHAKQLGLARMRIRPGEVDMVVFPENAVLQPIEGTPYLEQFQDLSDHLGTPLLAGVSTRTKEDLERMRRGLPQRMWRVGHAVVGAVHNSAAIIGSKGIVDKYDKMHLLPFSERPPAEPLFAALGLLDRYRRTILGVLGYVGTGQPGDDLRLLRVPGDDDGAAFWTPLCYEQADARLSREARLRGARCFINITSEGDLGPQIYWNTVAISTLRAVEARVGVVRCGNQGISGAIDPWGRLTQVLRGKNGGLWQESGVLKVRAPLGPREPPVYTRIGDWPVGAASLVLLGAVVVGLRRRT